MSLYGTIFVTVTFPLSSIALQLLSLEMETFAIEIHIENPGRNILTQKLIPIIII